MRSACTQVRKPQSDYVVGVRLNHIFHKQRGKSTGAFYFTAPLFSQIEYPVEAIIEIAIANFLNTEALGFADCQPGRGQ